VVRGKPWGAPGGQNAIRGLLISRCSLERKIANKWTDLHTSPIFQITTYVWGENRRTLNKDATRTAYLVGQYIFWGKKIFKKIVELRVVDGYFGGFPSLWRNHKDAGFGECVQISLENAPK